MRVTEDFRDLLVLLEREGTRYLIIGGYAYSLHAEPRYTKDLDIWVKPTADNVLLANRALAQFGSPESLNPEAPSEILQLGVEPNRIDLFLSIPGATFSEAWESRVRAPYGDQDVNWMGLDCLIKAKAAAGRQRDIADAATLRKIRNQKPE